MPWVGSWFSQKAKDLLLRDDGRVERDEDDLGLPGAPASALSASTMRVASRREGVTDVQACAASDETPLAATSCAGTKCKGA
jgi:hypothetical protein